MYIPIMKNRTVEVSVLTQLSELNVFGSNIIPMVEIVQEKTRSNAKTTFLQDLSDLLEKNPNMRVMVDFFKSTKLRNTSDSIREYISKIVRQPNFIITELLQIKPNVRKQIIPVVSYMSDDYSIPNLLKETEILRQYFSCIAFRFKPYDFNEIFKDVLNLINDKDFVILDVGSAAYTSPVFKNIYRQISDNKRTKHYTSIVVNAHRPEDLTNSSMHDKEPIGEIDNSLKDLYHLPFMCKFDGFGDYATISAALPTTGGAISPVGIYYSKENNYFVAFKGRKKVLSEFPEYIAPQILLSEYWNEYEDHGHHDRCPGCIEIEQIACGHKTGKNQAQWKMIAMLHYIYTLYQINA